jgi:hypothetical protein
VRREINSHELVPAWCGAEGSASDEAHRPRSQSEAEAIEATSNGEAEAIEAHQEQ